MRAFQIGRLESQSITNLMLHVPKSVVDALWAAVRPRGMRTWITHELLARELFNVSFSSATGSWEAWKAECVNRHDDHSLAPWHDDSLAHVLGGIICYFYPLLAEWLGQASRQEGLVTQGWAAAARHMWHLSPFDGSIEVPFAGDRLLGKREPAQYSISIWVSGRRDSAPAWVCGPASAVEHSAIPQDCCVLLNESICLSSCQGCFVLLSFVGLFSLFQKDVHSGQWC